MKLLLAGMWRFPIYERACGEALSRLGINVTPYAWSGYFSGLFGKAQSKWTFPGPAMGRINRNLLQRAQEVKPDVVFVWRGTHILPQTVRRIRERTGALMVSYNTDDPFGPQVHGQVPMHHHRLWTYYLRSIPDFDVHFVFRPVNLEEIKRAGAKSAYVLMPYFVPALHCPVTLTSDERTRYGCDVTFIGHYEPDGRIDYLRALVEAGVDVRLFGGAKYWSRYALGPLRGYFGEVREVWGIDYAKALCGAQMCLCFLSRRNRDTYTSRSFEIPACGQLLLSERTTDMQRFFLEGEEAVFFSTPAELVDRVLWLRNRPEHVRKIAEAGYRRVLADDHSVDGRMKHVVKVLSEHLTKRQHAMEP